MAITRQKKESLLKGMHDMLAHTISGVFVSFKGIPVGEINTLRHSLKKEGVSYIVVKKTLMKRALGERGITGTMPELSGEVAFAYLTSGDDITAPARGLKGSMKALKDRLMFLGGILNGVYLSAAETASIAAIPPTPVLRGMFVNIINSPIQRFVVALGEVAKKK